MAAPSAFTMSTLSSSLPTLARPMLPHARRRTATRVLLPLQSRHESTTRRMTKALRLHPHASFIGTASTTPSRSTHTPIPPPQFARPPPRKFIIPTIIHNPPAAAPNPAITPRLFLPPTDVRYTPPSKTALLTTAPTAAGAVAPAARPLILDSDGNPTTEKLPPALSRPYAKTYHLTEEDVKKIQRLRASDPDVWSRRKLAKKFGCSEFFVGMVAPVSEDRLKKMKEKTEAVKQRWGPVRRFAREERGRRRVLWGKDL